MDLAPSKIATDRSQGDVMFAYWLDSVDRLLLRKVGVSLFDLPDLPLRDMFDDGMNRTDVLAALYSRGDVW